ncbi:MAG: ABC transporter ATP-binding protein [Bacilli bacterium]
MSYLTVNSLSIVYDGVYAVHDVTFTVEKGEFVTLLGPSGCGKSTLLRSIAGITPVASGEICIDGESMTYVSPRHRNVGMVFQSYALFPNLTVFENIAYGLRRQGIRNPELTTRVEEMIRLVHLEGKESSYPRQLSGGQQQRVALARSLVVRPKVLLLDEPLGALDARIRRNLQTELRTIQRTLGMTMIFVTHDQDEAMIMSDRIIVMNEGHIEQTGTPETVYARPRSRFVASFMGAYNVIEGNVAFGEEGTVAIRPEVIQLKVMSDVHQRALILAGATNRSHISTGNDDSSERDLDNNHVVLEGVIEDMTLRGNVIRYTVRAAEESLFVDTLFSSACKNKCGEHVILTIPRNQIIRL